MSALDKVLSFAGSPVAPDVPPVEEVSDLVLAAQLAVRQLQVLLADGGDNDEDDTKGKSNGSGGGGSHAGHPTYKKLVGRGMNPKMAAAMCAKADNKVAASTLADSLAIMLTSEGGLVALAAPPGESAEERRQSAKEGNALPDGSYPIPDVKHLHSAATLAASKHGNWQAAQRLIRKRARELGVDINTLPGFGSPSGSSEKKEKVAATALLELSQLTGLPEDHAIEFLALARKAAVPLQAFGHGTHSGTHSHGHMTMGIHEHEHSHNRDSMHDRHAHGGPAEEEEPGGFGGF